MNRNCEPLALNTTDDLTLKNLYLTPGIFRFHEYEKYCRMNP